MRFEGLLEHWLLYRCIDVPDLEVSGFSADEEMIDINLVEVSWTVLVSEGLLDGLRSSLDVDVDNDDLLGLEAGNREHS